MAYVQSSPMTHPNLLRTEKSFALETFASRVYDSDDRSLGENIMVARKQNISSCVVCVKVFVPRL